VSPANLTPIGEALECARHRRPLGTHQLRQHVVGDRQRDGDAVRPHAAPAVGQMPEEQHEPVVDAPEVGDREL
jgi:hypothetical protein